MAFSVNGGGRRSGGGGSAAPPALSEINVTPFVDVVLVLLIIFMLTAHVMEFGIEVDVPKVQHVEGQRPGAAGRHHHQGRRSLPQRQDVNINELASPMQQRYPARPRASTCGPTRRPSGTRSRR